MVCAHWMAGQACSTPADPAGNSPRAQAAYLGWTLGSWGWTLLQAAGRLVLAGGLCDSLGSHSGGGGGGSRRGPTPASGSNKARMRRISNTVKPGWKPLVRPCPSTPSLTRPVSPGAQLLPAPRGEDVTPGQRVGIRTQDRNRSCTWGGGEGGGGPGSRSSGRGCRRQVCRWVSAARAAAQVGPRRAERSKQRPHVRGGLVGDGPRGPAGPCTSPLEASG